MKRATLLLATALLGTSTACSSRSSSPGDLTLFWSFQDGFGRTSGQPGDNNGCGFAGVDSVDVTIDGSTQTFTCTGPNAAGITLQTFAPGSYPFTAVGFRSNEQVFTGSGTATVVRGVNTETDVVLQALNPQGFVVFYSINGIAQCNFVGLVGIVYRLVDSVGRIVSTTEAVPGDATRQTPIVCDPVNGFTIPNLPFGTYSFDYLAAVDSINRSLFQVCTATVAHGGFPDLENLTRATTSCL
jgi:hypothetical protein